MSRITEDCKLGDAIHASFRTATKCEQATTIWHLIEGMSDEDWNLILESIFGQLPRRVQQAMETEALAVRYEEEE